MKHLIFRALAGLGCGVLMIAASTVAPNPSWRVYASPQRLVRLPDGRAMNIYCIGSGSPTVLLDAGLGDSAVIWRKVHSRLAERTRVCAFDRAGSGFSDPGPLPRDAVHIAQDMKALFEAAGLKPPYVLVGHSLGGLNVRYYADLHLKEIVGMVLVEPATEHQDKRIGRSLPRIAALFDQQRAILQGCLDRLEGKGKPGNQLDEMCKDQPAADLPPAANAAAAALNGKSEHLRSELSEFDGIMGPSSDQAAAARRSYGSIPLVVLTAAEPRIPGLSATERDTLLGIIKQMHGELAALSTRGVDLIVPGSSHYVQIDAPQAVIDAVSQVLSQVANSER
ncbi:MAG: alpha/beta hydrolase [Proteobacteria bacterium]|nr:alpha/beta hydrolase [Pseudomonadota bacterium]